MATPGKDYDVIVVGAGSGGCLAALHAARGGARVLLVEKRPEDRIGAKVSFDSIKPTAFDDVGLPRPEGEELDATGTRLRIFSPSKKHWADCEVPNLLVHRGRLGQRLLRYAREAGVELMAGTEVAGVIIEEGPAPADPRSPFGTRGVAGIRVRPAGAAGGQVAAGRAAAGIANGSTGGTAVPGTGGSETAVEPGEEEIRARVTIDAGGFFAPVRRLLPPDVLPAYPIAREDTIHGYREVRRLVGEDSLIPPADYPGYYDFLGYEGGYLWAVREADGWVNVGIGVLDRPTSPDYETGGRAGGRRGARAGRAQADAVQGGHAPLPVRGAANLVRDFCRDNPAVGDETLAKGHGGSPYIPLRRCLPRLVANGFMAVGDAAYQVCPGTGYGICSSMAAGKLAGEVAARAVQALTSGAASVPAFRASLTSARTTPPFCPAADLWPYDVGWKRGLGAEYAFIDAIRILVTGLPGTDVDWLIGRGIMGSREFSPIWVGKSFDYTLGEHISKGLRGLGRPRLLLKLVRTFMVARAARRLYRNAPDTPTGAEAWEKREARLFDGFYRSLGIERTYRAFTSGESAE